MFFTLVASGPHHVRYLAGANDGGSPDIGNIQLSGLGDADVALEDAVVAGPLREIISATVTNKAEARRLAMDDGLGAGTPEIAGGLGRAVSTVMGREGVPGEWQIDADTDGAGGVKIVVSSEATAGEGEIPTAYVEILFRHSYTQR